MKIELTTESQVLALRRVISRNLPEAPEKDKPFLRAIYESLGRFNADNVTGDLFI